MAGFALAATALAAVTSAYGSYQQGKANQAMYNYQAQVAQNNQTIANQYANYETQKGQVLEQQKRIETGEREGAIRAAVGASGLRIDSGSPLRLQEDTARLGELDAQTIRANANAAAYGYKVQGMNFAAQASLDETAASNASRFGALGAFSSIIGGASQFGSQWATFKQAGMSPFGG